MDKLREKQNCDIEKVEKKIMDICPYCKEKTRKKKTCGGAVCQWKHHIESCRNNWDKKYNKTGRHNKRRANESTVPVPGVYNDIKPA